MTCTDYPGHFVVAALAAVLAALTFVAFLASEPRAPARRPYRWLLMALQYAVILVLLTIGWNPSTLQMSEVFERNSVVTLFDTSGSMSVADDGRTARLDKAVDRFATCFHPEEPTGPRYRVYGFDRLGYHCGSVDSLRRWGDETNLHAALALIADCAADDVPAGAVIFTDGRVADTSLHRYLPPLPRGTPLLLVGVGSRTAQVDLAIRSISGPAQAWIEMAYPVTVAIEGANLSSDSVIVELLRDAQVVGSRAIASNQLHWSADRRVAEATAEFSVVAQQLGTHVLTARVAPHQREINTANNTRSTVVEVSQEQRLRVLLYSQRASFDVGKVRQALTWDKRIDLDFRLDVIRDPVLAGRAVGSPGDVALPQDDEGLREFDVIVLGPCDFGRFPSSQREALYRFVAERGGGLLLLPGPAVTGLASGWGEPGDAMLPVILDARDPLLQPPVPDAIQLSFEARIARVFEPNAFADPEQSISPRYRVARTKPAATTLATAGETPIVAAQRLGRGRVCLLNASKLFTLYREDRQGGLLGDLVCGLAAYLGVSPSGGTGIELFVERAQADPRRVEFSAYVTDKRFEAVNEANVLLTVGNRVTSMQPAGAGRYTAKTDLGPVESVVATAQAEVHGAFLGERTIAVSLPPIRDEMSKTDLDEEFLKPLAARLGATYLHADDLDDRVASAFAARQQVGTTQKTTSMWPTWPLLLALCLILSIKWYLRRAVGLV